MDRLQNVGHWMYLALGWIGLIALYPLVKALPTPGILWLVSGGLLYSFGVIFYVGQRIFFNHFIWHLFVIAGAICHFLAIFYYVSPMPV
jgi:hemolysin III